MKPFLLFCLALLLISSCDTTNSLPASKRKLIGTTWQYTDEGGTFNIIFARDGRLQTTHPSEVATNIHLWRQEGNHLHFELNDGYATYDGTFMTPDSIAGEGRNHEMKWAWTLTRLKKK